MSLLLPSFLLSLASTSPSSDGLAISLLRQLPLESEELASTLAALLFSLSPPQASWLSRVLGAATASPSLSPPPSLTDPSAAKRVLALQEIADGKPRPLSEEGEELGKLLLER